MPCLYGSAPGVTTREISPAGVLGALGAFPILGQALPPSRFSPTLLVHFALVLLASPGGASAQEPAAPEVLERAALRLRYGLALREGAQREPGPGLTYTGVTPNDVAVWGTVYGLGLEWLGGQLSVQREAFTLRQESERITEGSLLRASVGLLARRGLGPVWGELGVGYGFSQIPLFGGVTNQAPAFERGGRHAAVLGGRVRVPILARMEGEVRGEIPLALAARDAAGGGASASGFSAGAALLFRVKRMGPWEGAAVLDYQYVRDGLTVESGVRSEQTLQRVGVALQLSWFDAQAPLTGEEGRLAQEPGDAAPPEERVEEPPPTGSLRIVVTDKLTNQPMADVPVGVGKQQVRTSEAGLIRLEKLPPGPVLVKVSAPGFQAVEEAVVIVGGQEVELPIPLEPARKVGYATISGTVRSTRQGRPLVATLSIPSAKVRRRTDAKGGFSVKLKPGTHRIIISAKGHLTQTKSVTVRDGEQAIFNVDLFPRGR